MSLTDAVLIEELTQTDVDPNTNATTIHTKLNLPDGGTGFIIIGRVITDKKKKWEPLKNIISQLFIQYHEKFNPLQVTPQEDSLLAQ